jgi:hypothetical protein
MIVLPYQNRAQFQLWISGLSPSAYWFGQALFEVPVYCALILSIFIAFYASAPPESKFTVGDLFIQVSDTIPKTTTINQSTQKLTVTQTIFDIFHFYFKSFLKCG